MKEKELIVKDYQTKDDIKFSDFVKFTESLGDGDIESVDPSFLLMRMLKIFYNINPKDSRQLKQSQLDVLVNKVNACLQLPKGQIKNIITLNGVEYGLIPNFLDITVGELIDMDKLFQEKNFINLTSILYRPLIGEVNSIGEYNIEEYKGHNDKFKDISLSIVEGYMDFFQKSFQILSHSTEPAIQ